MKYLVLPACAVVKQLHRLKLVSHHNNITFSSFNEIDFSSTHVYPWRTIGIPKRMMNIRLVCVYFVLEFNDVRYAINGNACSKLFLFVQWICIHMVCFCYFIHLLHIVYGTPQYFRVTKHVHLPFIMTSIIPIVVHCLLFKFLYLSLSLFRFQSMQTKMNTVIFCVYIIASDVFAFPFKCIKSNRNCRLVA